MTIEEMKRIKREKGLSYEMIAEGSGVSLGTVKKIFGGYVQSPRYDTLAALELFFSGGTANVREEAFNYFAELKEQGEVTIEDLENIPEDIRVELIDGVLYYQAAPSPIHQIIALELAVKLNQYIDDNGGECIAGMAATDFHLDPADDRTMVQPDVFVVCDPSKLGLKRITGSPDLAIEIISQSNTAAYLNKKMMKYRDSGVREYWQVDYDAGAITVILFDKPGGNASLMFYGVRDKIPVGIFDGLVIDFAKIDDRVQSYISKCGGRD